MPHVRLAQSGGWLLSELAALKEQATQLLRLSRPKTQFSVYHYRRPAFSLTVIAIIVILAALSILLHSRSY